MRFRDSPAKAFLRCNHGKEILHLDWENQGSFFSDPCLGFLQSCMLRLVCNIPATRRKHKPGLKIENWLPWTRGQSQAKRSAGPSSPSHGFCDFNGRGGENPGGF